MITALQDVPPMSSPRMSIAGLMWSIQLAEVVLATMHRPGTAGAFVVQCGVVVGLLVTIVRWLFHSEDHHAVLGCALGSAALVALWIAPIPIALMARQTGTRLPFGDV